MTGLVHPEGRVASRDRTSCNEEIHSGERFAFGDNWREFLRVLDESRIREAEISLQAMLQTDRLEGKRFLDAGSGSGLFSLAARRLGATVHSFDLDPASVGCTAELRRRFSANDAGWTVEHASVLDAAYLKSLGQFDVVYSWGVLHHTGQMWEALENVTQLVAPDRGQLFISIYNDQGRTSDRWRFIKRTYCQLPWLLKPLILYPAALRLWGPTLLWDLLRLRPFRSWKDYHRSRGMSPWRDVVDWVGGYPFEVAKPEEILDFYRQRGFVLTKLVTAGGGLGTNQFVFERTSIGRCC